MSDKRPEDNITPNHIPPTEGRPPANPHSSTRPAATPSPSGRPTHPSHAERRPAPRPPGPGEPPLRRPAPGDPAKHPRPTGNPTRRPQASSENPLRRRPSTADTQRNPEDHTTRSASPSRAKRRTRFAAFNILMIIIIAGVCLTIFAMSFQRIFAGDRDANAQPTPTPLATPTPSPINTQNLTGLITNLNDQVTPRVITLFDIETNQSRNLTFLDTTTLTNRQGISMPFAMLAVGNMMEASYNAATNELLAIGQSFTRDFHSRTGLRIDMDNATITIGNDVLNFTSQTLVMYRGEPFHLSDVTTDDTITIIAVGDTIWLIQIESGHGFLQIANASTIHNGRLILDPLGSGSNRIAALDDVDGQLTIPEGTYRVTVEGNNIETYITEIVIRHGETTILDLSDVEPGLAMLELTVTPAASRVYINGELRQASEPMEFEFGAQLVIRVEHHGYYTHERTVEIAQATTTVTINLEEEVITSRITILTEPIGANVWINNQPVGQSPVITDVQPGNINILLQMYGFYNYSTFVYVHPGESTHSLAMIPVTVEPPPQEDYHPGSSQYYHPSDDDHYGDDE